MLVSITLQNYYYLMFYLNCSQGWYQPSNSCKKHFNEISEIWVVGPLQSTICLALLYGVDT